MKNTYKLKPVLRSHIVCVRWTPDEVDMMKYFSAKSNITISKYIRQSTYERLRVEHADIPLEKFE